MENLVVAILGNRNSGKSSTWYHLFEKTVKTGKYIRPLYLNENEFVEVFLVSGSPEERDMYVGDMISTSMPRIVLCSMQYHVNVHSTIDYFNENNFLMYCQWLNPGYQDQADYMYFDSLGLMNKILSQNGILSIRNGKANLDYRCEELRSFIYGWAKAKGLIKSDIV